MSRFKQLAACLVLSTAVLTLAGCPHHHRDHYPPPPDQGHHDHDHDHDNH